VPEVVQLPMQFNTAPAGLFDTAPVRGNFQSMYFFGNHTHQIDLDGSPEHDMGRGRMTTTNLVEAYRAISEKTGVLAPVTGYTIHIE
jgi:hypothetical protein